MFSVDSRSKSDPLLEVSLSLRNTGQTYYFNKVNFTYHITLSKFETIYLTITRPAS